MAQTSTAPNECCVCLERACDTRLSCGHCITCRECSQAIFAEAVRRDAEPLCPVCRAVVRGYDVHSGFGYRAFNASGELDVSTPAPTPVRPPEAAPCVRTVEESGADLTTLLLVGAVAGMGLGAFFAARKVVGWLSSGDEERQGQRRR